MRDLHSNIRILRAIDPQAVGTTGAANGVLSQVIDRQGFESAEFVLTYGTKGATGDSTDIIVYESATTTTGDFTAVADADMLGTEADAGVAAAAHVSGSTINLAKKIGYIGNERYLRLRIYGTGHATGLVGAVCVLSNADESPVSSSPG